MILFNDYSNDNDKQTTKVNEIVALIGSNKKICW